MKKINFFLLSIIVLIHNFLTKNLLGIESFNKYNIEDIDHWVIKISSVKWDSATIKNSLQIPYITLASDIVKGKYNLLINDIPSQIQGKGIELSTPACKENTCSDFNISLYTSGSQYFISYGDKNEISKTTFTAGTNITTYESYINSETIFEPVQQSLNNLFIGYHKDYFWFQNSPYLRNFGIRFGLGLDIYQYKFDSESYSFLQSLLIIDSSDNSLDSTNNSVQQLYSKNSLDYIELALQIKLGINYVYEFLEKNLIFFNFDYLYGYGAVSYKLKEYQINLNLPGLLNSLSGNLLANPFLLEKSLPQSKLTDGPSILEITGYKVSLAYAFKIDPKQMVRFGYSYREKTHRLMLPKIEPDETINYSSVLTGDFTPILLSQIKTSGILPKNKDTLRDISIEYMYRF